MKVNKIFLNLKIWLGYIKYDFFPLENNADTNLDSKPIIFKIKLEH